MDKNMKVALIVIGVLVALYYLISPYQECMRDDYTKYDFTKGQLRSMCSHQTKW